jgi:hypothetical protein
VLDREIRILVAEEEKSFAMMVEDSLKLSGGLYSIEKVSSGGNVLRCFRMGILTSFS